MSDEGDEPGDEDDLGEESLYLAEVKNTPIKLIMS